MGSSLDLAIDRVKAVKEDLRSLLRETWRFKLTHEDMLERRVRLYESNTYKRLPRWAKSEVKGHFEALYNCQVDQHLFWTHVLDGERVLTHDRRLNDRHGELDSSLSYHCYAVEIDGIVRLVPQRAVDRARELETPRLTQAVLNRINRRMMPNENVDDLFICHRPNGTPYPAKLVEV